MYCPGDRMRCRRVGKMGVPRYAFVGERVGDWVYAVAGGSAD